MNSLALAQSENARFEETALLYERVLYQVKQVIVGQDDLIEKVMLSIVIGGHCLIESAPGLAKTLLLKTVAAAIKGSFKRVQFTPDLLPSDLIGLQIYNQNNHSFSFTPGPIFGNLVLVDEINRAPAKVQSALLEAMQERQVTVAGETHTLDDVFVVLATQNPLEHEGTYALPEAQVDRFTFKLNINYPNSHEEESIVLRFCIAPTQYTVQPICSTDDLLKMRRLVDQVFIDPEIIHIIVQIVQATRQPKKYGLPELQDKIENGASPRASIALTQASKGLAMLRGRSYVLRQDLQDVLFDTLRHRIRPSYRATLDGIGPENIIRSLMSKFLALEVKV
jgi:MoxR-like ATPase